MKDALQMLKKNYYAEKSKAYDNKMNSVILYQKCLKLN
jgi:hypothetical protein